tara:strand:- start:130 stop:888 length:759 start_codon:yes stop_codon:yes gene_type:complete
MVRDILVTVIIPTYNRFRYLLNALRSVKSQSHSNIEIIVVNDCSTEEEYYTYDYKKEFGDNIYIIHLPRNGRDIYGFVAPGSLTRNIGLMLAKGEYISFLDDDDLYLPTKIEKQLKIMKEHNSKFCCTEGFIGKAPYVPDKEYSIYHYKGHYWGALRNIFSKRASKDILEKMFENEINVWTEKDLLIHNCIITSSVMMHKSIIQNSGHFPVRRSGEDYAYWKKAIKETNVMYIREPLVWYDNGHGDGRLYGK